MDPLSYEKSVLIYKKDGLYGLINFEGKEITKNLYNSIENLQPTEGKFLVSKDEKYGTIDLKGNILIKTEYDEIESDGYYTEETGYIESGFIVANKTDDGYKYGYINNKGKVILEPNYNQISRILKEDKNLSLIVSENGQYGIYKNNKKILENEYQEISYDDELDVLIIQKNKKYGVANLEGKFVIDISKDEITSKGIYLYTKEGTNQKVYDESGKVIDINFNRNIYKTENDNYRISVILNNNITYYGVVDKEGNQLINEDYRYIEYLFDDYFIATNENGNMGIINKNGREILSMKYSSLQKLKGKNIIQAVNSETNETEFYSGKIKKVLNVFSPSISIQDEYIIVSNDDQKNYLDKDGNVISDISPYEKTVFPEEIGEYKKVQITIEKIYYTKNFNNN